MKKTILLIAIFFSAFCIKAQMSICDSLSYSTSAGPGITLNLNTSGVTSLIDSMSTVEWSVCNHLTCYLGSGLTASFQNILLTDTIKVEYEVFLYIEGVEYFCKIKDSLYYDSGSSSWELLPGSTTQIDYLDSYFLSEFYPNPAKDVVYFDYSFNSPAKLMVMDILGNQSKSIDLFKKGVQKIDISELSKGIYFGNLMVKNDIVAVKKIVVR